MAVPNRGLAAAHSILRLHFVSRRMTVGGLRFALSGWRWGWRWGSTFRAGWRWGVDGTAIGGFDGRGVCDVAAQLRGPRRFV